MRPSECQEGETFAAAASSSCCGGQVSIGAWSEHLEALIHDTGVRKTPIEWFSCAGYSLGHVHRLRVVLGASGLPLPGRYRPSMFGLVSLVQ